MRVILFAISLILCVEAHQPQKRDCESRGCGKDCNALPVKQFLLGVKQTLETDVDDCKDALANGDSGFEPESDVTEITNALADNQDCCGCGWFSTIEGLLEDLTDCQESLGPSVCAGYCAPDCQESILENQQCETAGDLCCAIPT